MFHSDSIDEIINIVNTKERIDLIFSHSKKYFDLHQFNVSSLCPKDVKKMNQSLKRRYKQKEIQILPTKWNQGERRFFVWFIICFLYEKKIKIQDITQKDLKSLSQIFYAKDTIFLDFQLRNLPKVTKSKRNWTNQEDELLKRAIMSLKRQDDSKVFNNWNDVAKIIFFKTQRRIFRTPKSCRQRWYNHLDESKKKDEFSTSEDLVILNYILNQSKSWSKIVKEMNYSRTEHRIKNRYYTMIRKYQRSDENLEIEEYTEQQQRQIALKLKAAFEAKLETQSDLDEFKRESNLERIKIEDSAERNENCSIENEKKVESHQNSEQTQKLKAETEQCSPENQQKMKIMQESSAQHIISNSSALIFNHNENSLNLHQKIFNPIPLSNNYWPQNYISYPQSYCADLSAQQMEAQQFYTNPIIMQEYYCHPTVYFQNGLGYSYYQH